MSDTGGPDDPAGSAPPPGTWPLPPYPGVPLGPPAPPPPPRRSRGRWLALAVALLLLAAGAGTAGMVLYGADETEPIAEGQPRRPVDEDSPNAGEGWDKDVLPYVDFVEEERELEFHERVPVDYLTDKEFRKKVTADEEELTAADRREMKQFVGLFRAAGLLEGEIDLFDSLNDLHGAGVVGYYSYKDKRIRIRGKELTPASRATLVHELTHALQDQHFDLERQKKRFEKSDAPGESAYDALVEGDASRIGTAYVGTLSGDEAAAYREEQAAQGAEFREDAADIPSVLVTFLGAPYGLGEAMLALALERGDAKAVDALFSKPPTTDEHLLDPWTLLLDEDRADTVPTPTLERGDRRFDTGEFGAMMWYLLLAERVPVVQALDATDGWGGDSFVGFERDGRTCFTVRYRGETPLDRDQMHRALRAWTAALPGSPASVHRVAGDLLFESCDPGPEAEVGSDSSGDALQLVLTRTQLGVTLLDATGEEERSRCVANQMVHAFTLAQIRDEDFWQTPAAQLKTARVGMRCR